MIYACQWFKFRVDIRRTGAVHVWCESPGSYHEREIRPRHGKHGHICMHIVHTHAAERIESEHAAARKMLTAEQLCFFVCERLVPPEAVCICS